MNSSSLSLSPCHMEGNDEELEVSRLLDIIRKEQQRQNLADSNQTQFSEDVHANVPSIPESIQSPDTGNLSGSSLILLRSNLIPVLYNLATQILQMLGRGHYENTLRTINHAESEEGQAYLVLLDLFLKTKQVFSSNKFIGTSSRDPLRTRLAIQRADLATYALAVFGCVEVGFYYLNEYFLDTFISPDGKFLKSQATLFLELKTQAYLMAMDQLNKPKYEVLDQLFPANVFPGPSKSPVESEFEQKCQRRRYLLESNDNITDLQESYSWMNFVREMHRYLNKQTFVLDEILPPIHSQPRSSTNDKTRSISRSRHAPSATGTTTDAAVSVYEAARDRQSRTGASSPYGRRPWTKEEEAALLKGLDKVQGPYWSQILKLHGPGGTESEILKDRSQVQLKDKARNLKMFFIKCGLPLPTVFEYVTGDLRSRSKAHQRNKAMTISPITNQHEPSEESQSIESLMEAVGDYMGEDRNNEHLMNPS